MTTPGYNPQVPLPSTTIPVGQDLFLNNFGKLYDAFSVNHIPLDDPTNPGNHNVIQLLEQTDKQSTRFQEIAIYSKKVADQTDQLFMRYQGNGKEFQLTQYQIYEIPDITSGTPPNAITLQKSFFTFLPGGIIVYFGRVNPTGDNFPINLDPAICGNIISINLSPIGTSTFANSLYQSNVNLVLDSKGKYNQVLLLSSFEVQTPPNQYYAIWGNI